MPSFLPFCGKPAVPTSFPRDHDLPTNTLTLVKPSTESPRPVGRLGLSGRYLPVDHHIGRRHWRSYQGRRHIAWAAHHDAFTHDGRHDDSRSHDVSRRHNDPIG